MVAKKKRSAKQLAATKKLLAFNKKRRAKNPHKRKAVKRKAPAKKRVTKGKPAKSTTKRTRLTTPYMVAIRWGNKTYYYTRPGYMNDEKVNAKGMTKNGAERSANSIFNKHKSNGALKWVKVLKK